MKLDLKEILEDVVILDLRVYKVLKVILEKMDQKVNRDHLVL